MPKRFLALLLCLVAAGAVVVGQAVPPGTGLVAYWTLNETANPTALDSAGSAPQNNGTYLGTTLPTTSPSVPQAGGLAHPPGNTASRIFTQATANQWVEAPDAADLNLTSSLTLAAWVNPTGAQTNQMGIIEKFSTGTTAENGYFLRLNPAMIPKALVGNGTAQFEVQAAGALTAGAWSHVAATFDDATDTFRIYVNAGAPVTATGVSPPTASTNPLHIGADYGPNRFNGNIDEVRIYSRALSAGEIGVLRNGQAPPTALAATPGPGSVSLTWTAPAAVAGVTVAYTVQRSTTSGGPYTVVATGVNTTSYNDTGLGLGVAYFYVVNAASVLESVNSGEATTVTLNPTPRTSDHEEGLFGDQCSCGASAAAPGPWAAGLALLGALLLRRRFR